MRHNRNNILKCIILSIVILLLGCNQKAISYQKAKKLHQKGYGVKLNGKEIDPNFHFLAKDNTVIIRFKDQKQVLITQKDTTASKFTDIAHIVENFKKNLVNGKSELKIVVIDGKPFMEDEFGKVSIEVSTIKSLSYMTQDELFKSLSHARGDCLIITIK